MMMSLYLPIQSRLAENLDIEFYLFIKKISKVKSERFKPIVEAVSEIEKKQIFYQ